MKTVKNKIIFLTVLILISFFINAFHASASTPYVYDVVVVGAEPEGIAAAVAAARNGMKTLLIDRRPEPGGLFIFGMLNYLDIPYGQNNQIATGGIFSEWHKMVGGGIAFDIDRAKKAFYHLLNKEENICLLLNTSIKDVEVSRNQLGSLTLNKNGILFSVKANFFIDATQDAELAAMCGVPYFTGGEDIGILQQMAATLVIHLKNVQWEGIKKAAEKKLFGPAGLLEAGKGDDFCGVAWGFGQLVSSYNPEEKNTRLRGLNIALVGNDCYINGLHLFEVNGLDQRSRKKAMERGKKESFRILDFLRKNFPGFAKATMAEFPKELYIRETRHIKALYQLPVSDIWENRDHYDCIAYGAYPVDIQARTIHDYGYVICDPVQYAIPFRSLVPEKIDGLLVVGRSAGYSSLASGSTRIVPTGMGTGQAAGTATAIARKYGVNLRELAKNKNLIEELRSVLKRQGARIDHFSIPYPYQYSWFYPAVKNLLNYGLICGGYKNDLEVDKPASIRMFINLLISSIKRANPDYYQENKNHLERIYSAFYLKNDMPLTRDQAVQILDKIFYPGQKGIFEPLFQKIIGTNRILLRKEVYFIAGTLLSDFPF